MLFFLPNIVIPTSTTTSHAKFSLGTTLSNVLLTEFKSVMDVVIQYHPLRPFFLPPVVNLHQHLITCIPSFTNLQQTLMILSGNTGC